MNAAEAIISTLRGIYNDWKERQVTGWSSGENLVVGNESKFVKMQRQFHTSRCYTVSFDIQDIGFPEAIVTWSVAGNQHTRRVTVGNGTSLTAPAEAVDVKVTDARPAEMSDWDGESYGVAITVAPGTRAGNMQPPTLFMRDAAGKVNIEVPAASTVALLIPDDAGAVSVHVTSVYKAGHTSVTGTRGFSFVQQITDNGTPQVMKEYDPNVNTNWVPLVPGANILQLVNVDPSNAMIFNAVLGIDG